jgi:hypothetical protein
MTKLERSIWVVIVAAALFGCGSNNNSNSTIEEGGASGSIVVHVSDGNPVSQPLYTWSDGSLSNFAVDLKVARQSAPNVAVWEIQSTNPSQDLIQAPWQQGTSSSSVIVKVSTETNLEADVWYVLTVTKVNPSSSGTRQFRIKP